MWTQHRIDTEKLYLLTKEKNKTDTKEKILAAICINLINIDNAITNICTWRRQIINRKFLKGNRLLNTTPEVVAGWDFVKKSLGGVFLQILLNHSQESTCVRVSFLIKLQPWVCNFIIKETLAQVLSCEFCETFKNTFFTEHLRMTASMTH